LSYVNPLWTRQRDHAKADGLVWGGYHYPFMGNSPRAEADFFLSRVAWQPGDVIILDWEGYDSSNALVPHGQQVAYKDAWLRYVKAKMPNNRVGMYCNADYWNNVDTSGFCADFLWIATSGRAAGDPGIHAPWVFHQYNDNPIDADYCPLADSAALRAWAVLTVQPTTTTPSEDIVTPEDIAAVALAVWNHTEPDPLSGGEARMGTVQAWRDQVAENKTSELERQIAASTAAITALIGQLSAQHGLDEAAIVAAVQKAIADAATPHPAS
jgi:hypothetical protein